MPSQNTLCLGMNNLSKQERHLGRIYCFYSAKCKFCVLICVQFRSFLWHWCNVMERAAIKRVEKTGRIMDSRKKREISPKRKFERTVVRVSSLVCGCYFSPHSCHGSFKCSLLWATSVSHQCSQWAALIPKVPARPTGKARAQAGRSSQAACAARSAPEAAGRVRHQDVPWDRSCRSSRGELALFHTSEWERVSSASWRGLGMPRVWCTCPTLEVYLKTTESGCNELNQIPCLIWKVKFLILCCGKIF